jgi:hypothetical protein
VQGFSADFTATIQESHTAVVAAQAIQNGKVVADLEVHAGSVSADRTAAQMRTFQFEVIDRDGTLTPDNMTSLLAPFGTRIQLYRGVRIKNVETQSAFYDAAHPWTPRTLTGQMVSVKLDPSDGSLTLGP